MAIQVSLLKCHIRVIDYLNLTVVSPEGKQLILQYRLSAKMASRLSRNLDLRLGRGWRFGEAVTTFGLGVGVEVSGARRSAAVVPELHVALCVE